MGSASHSLLRPPGTGKTTTVVELIQQAVRTFGMKVLVTAPSNVAVDNVLARLVADQKLAKAKKRKQQQAARIRVVRLGHPARLQTEILPYSLEALVQASEGTEIVADVRQELQSFLRILSNPKSRGNDKRTAYREIKALRKEVRTREEKVVTELLQNTQVVMATCVGAANKLLKEMKFDLVVIDEAAQALEAACWIPALRGTKLVLAGDHCQLPPTIKNNAAKVQQGLGRTMFERLMELYGDNDHSRPGRISRMLQVQYRMHQRIADWASQALYGGELQTHESVKSRTLSQMTGKTDDDGVSEMALLLIDTAGCSMHETVNAAGSRFNEGEAQIVAQHVRTLLELGVQQDQIAIITPYNGQVEILRSALLPDYPKLEIRSVDGFQGGEREAVVLSLVRSSERGGIDGIGFLRDNRRLNVAVTRAKRHCCVICDSETVSQSKFVKNLIEWIEEHGEQRSAMDYTSESTEGQMESDLIQAETEIQKMEAESAIARQDKEKARTESEHKVGKPREDERRKALEEKIKLFSEVADPGEQMALSTELSNLDRKIVHEIAEEINIGHRSEGIDGVDRRIILSIPNKPAVADTGENEGSSPADVVLTVDCNGIESQQSAIAEPEEQNPSVAASFAALQVDASEDEESEDEASESRQEPEDCSAEIPMNNLLGSLAMERAQRDRRKQAGASAQAVLKNESKKKASKGRKLGGAKKPSGPSPKINEGLEDLDDMAFLDAQIETNRTSHGIKFEGKGRGYRSVMNGILMPKPKEEAPKKKDSRASAALQNKLKQAQDSRKSKSKKKK